MNDLRKEFEAWAYSNKWNIFHCRVDDEQYVDDFVNGAWHAFQERQKKIDAVLKITNEYWLDDDQDYHVYIQRIEEALK